MSETPRMESQLIGIERLKDWCDKRDRQQIGFVQSKTSLLSLSEETSNIRLLIQVAERADQYLNACTNAGRPTEQEFTALARVRLAIDKLKREAQ